MGHLLTSLLIFETFYCRAVVATWKKNIFGNQVVIKTIRIHRLAMFLFFFCWGSNPVLSHEICLRRALLLLLLFCTTDNSMFKESKLCWKRSVWDFLLFLHSNKKGIYSFLLMTTHINLVSQTIFITSSFFCHLFPHIYSLSRSVLNLTVFKF